MYVCIYIIHNIYIYVCIYKGEGRVEDKDRGGVRREGEDK